VFRSTVYIIATIVVLLSLEVLFYVVDTKVRYSIISILPASMQTSYIAFILNPNNAYFRNNGRKVAIFEVLDYDSNMLSYDKYALIPYVDEKFNYKFEDMSFNEYVRGTAAFLILESNDDDLIEFTFHYYEKNITAKGYLCSRLPFVHSEESQAQIKSFCVEMD